MGQDTSDDERRRRRWRAAFQIAAIIGALVFGLYVRKYHYQTGYVPSKSMSPTLQPGDRYLLKKDAYRSHAPQRGDIIVFRDPEDSEILIKRVVALSGDEVLVGPGELYRRENGKWAPDEYGRGAPSGKVYQRDALIVPDGTVYVMGDNRSNSEDSRDFGPVPLEMIIGRATRIVWPLGRAGAIQ